MILAKVRGWILWHFGVLQGFRGCWGGECCGGGEKGVDGALARCVWLLVAG